MEDNIDYLKDFFGDEWIKAEFEKTEKRSMLKEVGARYFNYHPFVQYQYELLYLIRRADNLKKDDVVLMENWEKLNKTGCLLKLHMMKIEDKNEFLNRLKSAELFDDVLWELEVATIFLKNNINYDFKIPSPGDSNDLTCYIDNRALEIECKNKHIFDERFNKNDIFSHMLCNEVGKIKELYGKTIEFEYEEGCYEDIKTIVQEIKSKLLINNSVNTINKYRIEIKSDYSNMSPEQILNLNGVQRFYLASQQRKSDLYNMDIPNINNSIRIIIKFPKEVRNIKNIDSLIKTANKQLPNGGVIFLKVPYYDFDNMIKEIKKILNNNFSNIYCIKVVAFESEYIEDTGVKVSRREELVWGKLSNCKLTKKEFDFLSDNIAFSIYK